MKGPIRIENIPELLQQTLENEAAILEVLVASVPKGQAPDEFWTMLHDAAVRDDRLAELAFAYEGLQTDRRLKLMSGPLQAEVLMHAAEFFAYTFGDPDGAESYLERVLAAVPNHPKAFAQLERLLEGRGEQAKLSTMYATAAAHQSDRQSQLSMLRKAASLIDGASGEDDKALKLYQQILKLDPGDSNTRAALETRYMAAGRSSDVCRLLEQALNADPPPDSEEGLAIRSRLIDLYSGKLAEIERCIPHVEEVLKLDPSHERAQKVAEQLLKHKAIAARAAAALEGVHESLGNAPEVARMLGLQVESLRGPRRLEAQKRLAVLLFERLGDLSGALPLLEAIVAADPTDDEMRQRYRTTSAAEGKLAQATRVLTRAATGAKDPALKSRIGAEVGGMYLDLGDEKKARAMFQQVLDGDGDEKAVLKAARALARICGETKEHRLLASVLDRLSQIEPDPTTRAASAERLARLCEAELKDAAGAIVAWRRLLGTSLEGQAQQALERLYEATGQFSELVEILELQAEQNQDAAAGRVIAMRAAELRVHKTQDRAATMEALRRLIATHGPARDVHELLLPLLEQERLWEELAMRLSTESSLTPEEERPAILVRIAQLKQTRLSDIAGAIEEYKAVLAIDSSERASRLALEKLLAAGDHRLVAGDILEQLYRAEQNAAGVAKVLEMRAELLEDPHERLQALAECAQIVERDLRDPKRALSLVGRGLTESANHCAENLVGWLDQLDRLAPPGGAPETRAGILMTALADREIDDDALLDLAKRGAEALVQCGDVGEALTLYRRGLAYAPSSPELLSRVDTLLQEQGSPEDRLAIYRDALDQPCDPTRRRELLHSIGAIQRRDLKDYGAAAETFRLALADDPADRAAYAGLLEVHEEAEQWDELYGELLRGLERAEGDERMDLELRMAAVSVTSGQPDRALSHYRDILSRGGTLADDVLDAIEALSEAQNNAEVLRELFMRRVELATDAGEEAAWLERLGAVHAEQLDDAAAAVNAWMRSARLSEGAAADADRAMRLYERVLSVSPGHREAATRLVDIYRRAEDWAKLVGAYLALLENPEDDKEATELVLALEQPAMQAGAIDAFIHQVDALTARLDSGRLGLWIAKARALAADPARQGEAAAAFRTMIEGMDGDDAEAAAEAFETFLEERLEDAERHDDRRWLWAWRAEQAVEEDRVRILLAWANVEHTVIGESERAVEVYGRVLEIDPEQDDALAARYGLLIGLGDVERAAEALRARRDRSEGAARIALELQLSELLLEQLERPDEAIAVVESVLDASPNDPAALRVVEHALGHPATRVRAARLLEKACENAEDSELEMELYQVLLSTPADEAELRPSRRVWYERLLDGQAAQPDAALLTALAAVEELPAETALWDRAERLARETGRPERVAQAYRRVLERAAPNVPESRRALESRGSILPGSVAPEGDSPAPQPTGPSLEPEEVEVIGQRGVEYHEEWFDEPDSVAVMLRRILEVAPMADWAFERLTLAYNAAERWDDLFDLYDRVLRSIDDEDAKVQILEDAAQAAKDFANDADRAIDYFAALIELRPNDNRAAATLERLYERLERHRPLIDLLSLQLGKTTEVDDAQQLRLRIAGHFLDGLGEHASAYEFIDKTLAADPECEPAYALLEKLVALPPEVASQSKVSVMPSMPPSEMPGRASQPPPSRRGRKVSVRHRAATLLKERYRSQDRPEQVVAMLEVELEGVTGTKERARRLKDLVALRRDMLGDEAGAFENLAALVALDPKVQEHRRELERLAESTNRFGRLAETFVDVADRLEDRKLRARLLSDAMLVYRDRLSDPTLAIELGRRVLDLCDDEPERALDVARDLERLLREAGRVGEHCDVLERLADLEKEPAARREALAEVARLSSDQLEDHERSIKAQRLRLADDPKDLAALDGLVASLRMQGRMKELVEALEQRAASTDDVMGARADRGEVARRLAADLRQPAEAITAWTRIRDDFGPDDESCDALADLLLDAGRHGELVEMLEVEVKRAQTDERSAALAAMLGDVHREGTGELDRAESAYRSAIETRVEEPRARRGLELMLERLEPDGETRGLYARVVELLTQISKVTDDYATTIDLLSSRLVAAADDADRIGVLRETALLHRDRRDDPVGAFECTWRAFLLDPTSLPVAEEVIEGAALAERWDVVARDLAEVLGECEEPPVEVVRSLWWRLADWQRDALQDPTAAEASYVSALAADPENVDLLAALAELQRRSKGRPLIETLVRLSRATAGDLGLLHEAVEIAVEHVQDRTLSHPIVDEMLETAVKRWSTEEDVTAGDPAILEVESAAAWALDVKVGLCREDQDDEAVREVLLRGSKMPFDPAKKRELLMSAAELSQGETAIVLFNELFEQDPDDVRVAGRLEALFRAEGRRDDLLGLRARQIRVAKTEQSRAALRLHVAALHIEAEETDRAIAVLKETLQELPTHDGSVLRISELYQAAERYADLLDLWEAQAVHAEEAEQTEAAAATWSRAAQLAEERLEDPRRAIEDYRRAVGLVESESALDALGRLLTGLGEHAAAAEVLVRLTELASEENLVERMLRLCDSLIGAGESEEARRRLEEALSTRDAVPELAVRLRALYEQVEAWTELAALLTKEAASAPDRATRLSRLREAADLHLDRRSDPASAIPLLEEAADLAPEDLSIRLAVCEAMREAGRFDEATQVLKDMVAEYGGRRPKDRALVHHELAHLALAAGDRARALGELDVAVKIDPGHPGILHAIATLALEEGQLARAQRMFRALLLVLRSHRNATASHRSGPPISRAEVLLELSDIAERQGEPDRAVEFIESAFEVAEELPEEAERLTESLRRREKFEMLARALEARLSARGESPDMARALVELADVYEDHLGRQSDALESRLKALGLNPGSAESHERTLALCRKLGKVERYLEALSSAIEVATADEDDSEKADTAVELLLMKGKLLEEEESAEGSAAEVYRQAEAILEQRIDDGRRVSRLVRIWQALEAVYAREGDVDAQAEVLEKLADGADTRDDVSASEKVQPLYQLAALRFGRADTHDDACGLLERAMDLDDEHDRVEQHLRASVELAPKEQRLLRLFEDFCRKTERTRALVDALLLLAEQESASPAWREAVDIASGLEDAKLAESILRRFLEKSSEGDNEPGQDAVWALCALAELCLAKDDVAEAASLKEKAGRVAPPDEERALLLSVARLAAGPLEDPERAAGLYEELREREPADRELWEPLMEVYRSLGETQKLSAIIETTVPLIDDLKERGNLRLERARIVLEEDSEQAAVELYEILEEDAAHEAAAAMLSEILEKAGRQEDLIELLNRQLDAAKDHEDKDTIVAVSMRLGALLEQRDQSEDALDIYHAALDWDAESREMLRAVVRLNIAREDSVDLGDSLERLLAVEEGEAAEKLALQLCELKRAGGDESGAEDAMALGYRACPSSVQLRDELIRRFTEQEAWDRLAEVYVLDASVREVPSERVERLFQAAELLRERAQNPAGAIDILEGALKDSPRDRDVLHALCDASVALGQPERGAATLTAAIEADEEEDPWLYRSRAAMHDAMGAAEAALDDLERAHRTSGGNYAREYSEQLELAAARAAEMSDAARERELQLRLAQVLHSGGDVDRARVTLSDIVRKDPRDRFALRALAALEESAERWEAVSATYRRLVSIEEGEALVDAALRLGEACERAERSGDARGGLERALRVNPSNNEVKVALRRVYEVTGANRELAELVLDDAKSAADVQGRYEYLLEAGRLLLRSDEDAPFAVEVIEEAAGLQPEEQDCMLLLSEAFAAVGRRGEAVNILLDAVASYKGRRSPRLGRVYETMARLELRDGNVGEALVALSKAFENDPSNHKLATELGSFAIDLDERDTAQRAFRAVTMMKASSDGSGQGPSSAERALAYYHLGQLANLQGDRRKARLMLEKSVSEDPHLEVAVTLLEELRAG